jgi:hypothetical protein
LVYVNGFKEKHKMKVNKHGEMALFVSLMAVSVLVVGCVVCQTDEHYIGIENEALKEVERGQTTKDQLIAEFGEPTEQHLTDEGAEILKYRCIRTKDNKFVMFPPPIVIKDDKAVEHTVAFELKDGVVQRYWKQK